MFCRGVHFKIDSLFCVGRSSIPNLQFNSLMSSCFICCEDYTKCSRAKITCCHDDCKYEVCKGCVRQYLLSTTSDPHCMNCKKAWSQKFVLESINRSFYDTDYKNHRKQLLLDTELSKMPETMAAAERYSRIKVEEAEIAKLNLETKKLREQMAAIETKRQTHNTAIRVLKTGGDPNKAERRAFIMPCPNNDCRGYLSTQYKCELCKLYTCPDCNELIGHNKTDEHTCNEDSKKSAELIKKETKPCTSCGTRIFKISGCDQMWCPECQVAFSWKTGKIDNGVVHNPHFYNHQRAQNAGGAPPRNPGDVVCGGICSFYELRRSVLMNCTSVIVREELTNCHRFAAHITHNDLEICRNRVRELTNNEELRVLYLNKEKTKDELKTIVFRNDNMRKKLMETLHIYELLSVVAIDGLNALCASMTGKSLVTVKAGNVKVDEEINEFLRTYKVLCRYCNLQMAEISTIFSNVVLQIETENKFMMQKKKFSLASVQKMRDEMELVDKKKTAGGGCSTDPV